MAGAFSSKDQHHFVSNKRFIALMEWAIEVAPEINDPKAFDHISKMQREYENRYSICTDIDFEKEFNKDEQIFWSKVFQVVAHKLFNRSLGSIETNDWRPSAIADAFTVSHMLQKLAGEYLEYSRNEF